MTPTRVPESTGRAVAKWISGKQTLFPQRILLTLALSMGKLDALALIAASARDTPRFVMLMDAISTPIAWGTLPSTVLARLLTQPKSSPLSLSSSRT